MKSKKHQKQVIDSLPARLPSQMICTLPAKERGDAGSADMKKGPVGPWSMSEVALLSAAKQVVADEEQATREQHGERQGQHPGHQYGLDGLALQA